MNCKPLVEMRESSEKMVLSFCGIKVCSVNIC
jgi:hypothetical protein